MEEQPFFSVCIPTYNYAHLLREAIDSVLEQTFADFELLILDNASTDNTDSVVAGYCDKRILYSKNMENIGIFCSLNNLCETANGKYIKILCADDVLSKWCLETIQVSLEQSEFRHKLVAVKETPSREAVKDGPSNVVLNTFEVNRNNLFEFLAKPDNWGGGLAELCVDRDFFKAQGYFGPAVKEKDFSKDIITWLKMALKTDALMIDYPLVFQRPHGGQARYTLSRITQLEEMLAFFYSGDSEMNACPDFDKGRRRYLDRYVLSHYWYGINSVMTGQGMSYLRQVRGLLGEFGHTGFPWRLAASKVAQRASLTAAKS